MAYIRIGNKGLLVSCMAELQLCCAMLRRSCCAMSHRRGFPLGFPLGFPTVFHSLSNGRVACPKRGSPWDRGRSCDRVWSRGRSRANSWCWVTCVVLVMVGFTGSRAGPGARVTCRFPWSRGVVVGGVTWDFPRSCAGLGVFRLSRTQEA